MPSLLQKDWPCDSPQTGPEYLLHEGGYLLNPSVCPLCVPAIPLSCPSARFLPVLPLPRECHEHLIDNLSPSSIPASCSLLLPFLIIYVHGRHHCPTLSHPSVCSSTQPVCHLEVKTSRRQQLYHITALPSTHCSFLLLCHQLMNTATLFISHFM